MDSGVSVFDEWAWCPGNYCTSDFDYTYWLDGTPTSGDCMGGYSEEISGGGGVDYGWVARECSETLVRAMCRLECDPEPFVTEEPTTQMQYTTHAPITQKLYYILFSKSAVEYREEIYEYVIDEVDGNVLTGKHKMPYSSKLPSIAFNVDLQVLEIVGDYYTGENGNHWQMNESGFHKVQNSLYVRQAYSTLVYTPNVGTLVIGGDQNLQSVYILTQKTTWPEIAASNNNLSDIQGSQFKYRVVLQKCH